MDEVSKERNDGFISLDTFSSLSWDERPYLSNTHN